MVYVYIYVYSRVDDAGCRKPVTTLQCFIFFRFALHATPAPDPPTVRLL